MDVTRDWLVAHLMELRGATPLTITARTDTKAKAKDVNGPNPFPRPVMKTSTVNGMVNFHYDAGVLRRLAKEGKSEEDFRRGESWHTPVLADGRLTPFCEHKKEKGQLYLRFMHLGRIGQPTFADATGAPVAADAIAPYLPAGNDYANQGLDAPLVFVTYNVANLLEVKVSGETYTIIG